MESTEPKILLVDDDPTFTHLYSSVFRINKINLSIAKNGTQGHQKAAEDQTYLILLDIMLPDINGFDVLKNLKQDPRTNKITVWVISNLAGQLNKNAAKSLGADDYLVKASNTPNGVIEKIKSFFKSQIPV
ncbi:response regulator [Patescibacteria group bacterium]|nr:response regulator [Patescibacteria group bacterium]